MQLLGRYLSPFVRRTAVTLTLYGMPFESLPLQHTGDDAPRLRELNPLGRVPALVLDDDTVIIDSAAIIDFADREVGPERALTPAGGPERTQVMSFTSAAIGAAEKAIATVYEKRFRPEEKRHAPWVERCAEQALGGFGYLNGQYEGDWLVGGRMTQADITTAVAWQFTGIANPKLAASLDAPKLDQLVERMMQVAAFADTHPG
jgi:glutathione S-transferase